MFVFIYLLARRLMPSVLFSSVRSFFLSLSLSPMQWACSFLSTTGFHQLAKCSFASVWFHQVRLMTFSVFQETRLRRKFKRSISQPIFFAESTICISLLRYLGLGWSCLYLFNLYPKFRLKKYSFSLPAFHSSLFTPHSFRTTVSHS